MTQYLFIIIFSLLFSINAEEKRHQDLEYPTISTKLTDISLQNTKGDAVSLNDIEKFKASVFVFFSPECPLSQNYTLTLRNLEKKFGEEGVKFYPVIPGSDFSLEEIKEFERLYKITISVLLDSKYVLTKTLAATVTPEAVIVDHEGRKIYQGKIDNWAFSLGKKRQVITEHYVEDALFAHLNQLPITTKQTTPVGCFIYAQGHE